MFPICDFEHLGELFSWTEKVAVDHPMVIARPELFVAKKLAKPRTPIDTNPSEDATASDENDNKEHTS